MRLFLKLWPTIFIVGLFFNSANAIAEWTVLVYMQADNNLSSYADIDMSEMADGLRNAGIGSGGIVNVFTQVDYPHPQDPYKFKTWRFKITPQGKIEDGSILGDEMGEHPATSLIKSVNWIHNESPAKHFAIILWNHGSGVVDYRAPSTLNLRQAFNGYWMDIFKDAATQKKEKKSNFKEILKARGLGSVIEPSRGILYDDSEKTCLTNQALTYALDKICNILGKKVDIIGMDACLMSMVEVAYEIKEYADVLVGSQEIEPGYGWDYDALAALAANPYKFGAAEFAGAIVMYYRNFYVGKGATDYTQSAINLNLLDILCDNINTIAQLLLDGLNLKSSAVRSAIRAARSRTRAFQESSYIDLCSFYRELLTEVIRLKKGSEKATQSCCGLGRPSEKYAPTLDYLIEFLNAGMNIIPQVVIANVAGPDCQGANGISIYYPYSKSIHPSYPRTLFARQSQWFNLLKKI